MSDENHNDPFEELFRKKAEEYNIQYSEEDWLKLEKKLDIRSAEITRKRKQIFLIAASVLIFSLLGYFTIDNHNRINELSRQLPEEPVAGARQSPADEEQSDLPEDSVDSETAQNPASDPERLTGAGEISDLSDSAVSLAEQRQPDSAEYEDTDELTGIDYRDTRVIFAANNSRNTSGVPYSEQLTSGFDFRRAAGLPSLGQMQGKYDEDDINTTDEEPVLAMNGFDGSSAPSKAAVSFIVSPDLSTAGSISNFYDPGYKIGFSVEYRINRNLSVSAGALQSKVQYNAPGREYNPPPYWNGGVTPDEITGVCLLIDIPVTVKYNFLNFDRSRFFTTAGFSSYIMLNEDYRFNYESGGAGMEEGWSGDTGTRHWLSNAGFSIGYEFDIHPNWSLRAEPFIKVPMKEVGWGNVKLYSIGSFVSINYNFL